MCQTDDRWTKGVTMSSCHWQPKNSMRRQARQRRCRDESNSFGGVAWNRWLADKDEWRRLEEAFVLQWTQSGWWWVLVTVVQWINDITVWLCYLTWNFIVCFMYGVQRVLFKACKYYWILIGWLFCFSCYLVTYYSWLCCKLKITLV